MNDSYGTRSLREIVRILFQHWLMIAFIVAAGGGATYWLCEYYVTPKYRSQVTLIFKRPQNRNPLSSDSVERALEVFVKAQQQILMSDLVLARALAISGDPKLRLKWQTLWKGWQAAQAAGGDEIAAALKDVNEFLTADGQKAGGVAARVDELMRQSAGQEQLRRFRKSVKLETPGGEQVGMTETFTIIVERPGPRGVPGAHMNANHAAELVAEMYMVRYQQIQQELNDPAARLMSDVVEDFRADVSAKKKSYESFIQAEENVADITALEQLLKSGTEQGPQIILTEVRKNDANLFLALAKDQAVHAAILGALPKEALEPDFIAGLGDAQVSAAVDSISSEFLAEDVNYVELAKTLVELEGRRARLAPQYMAASRDMQYVQESIRDLKRKMLGVIVGYVRGLEVRIAARQQQLARNRELVRENEEKLNGIHRKLAEYARLKNDFETAQKQLEKLEAERIEAITNKLRAREAVMISKLDGASVPDMNRPVAPLTGIYTAVAVAVSMLIGLALAFLADHFDHTLRSVGEAERYLGVPVLGSVKRRGRRLVVPI